MANERAFSSDDPKNSAVEEEVAKLIEHGNVNPRKVKELYDKYKGSNIADTILRKTASSYEKQRETAKKLAKKIHNPHTLNCA